MEKSIKLEFPASHNEAEYEAPIFALRRVFTMGATNVQLFTDSRLITNQFGRSFKTRDGRMQTYLAILGSYARQFKSVTITTKPRSKIKHADAIAFFFNSITYRQRKNNGYRHPT